MSKPRNFLLNEGSMTVNGIKIHINKRTNFRGLQYSFGYKMG